MIRWMKVCSPLLVLVAAVAAFFVSAPPVAQASPIRPSLAQDERGIAMGEYYFADPAQADNAIKLMKDAGFNSLRLIIKWNGQVHLEQYQVDAVCNAARAMVKNDMSVLLLNVLPKNTGWPNADEGRSNFIGTYNDLFSLLLNRLDGCATESFPYGKVAPRLSIRVMPVNEPNIVTFCDAGTDDGNLRHQICADWTARLVHAVYTDVQTAEAAYGVQIPVIGMALGSHHNPLGFLDAYCKSRATLGYKDAEMDYIGLHPYALQGSVDPFSGIRMTPDFKAAVKACFGKSIPVTYTESGFETTAPSDKGYTCTAPPGVLQVSPASYPALEAQLSRLATTYGVQGIYNFQLFDEQCLNPGWQSGLFYWDGSPKPFLAAIQALQAILGNPDDGP